MSMDIDGRCKGIHCTCKETRNFDDGLLLRPVCFPEYAFLFFLPLQANVHHARASMASIHGVFGAMQRCTLRMIWMILTTNAEPRYLHRHLGFSPSRWLQLSQRC